MTNDNSEEGLFGLPSRQQIVRKISDQSEPPNAKTFTLVGLDLFFYFVPVRKSNVEGFHRAPLELVGIKLELHDPRFLGHSLVVGA